MGVVFEEREVAGLDDDSAGSVLEVEVVVVFFLPPSLLVVSFLVVLLDCIGTTEGFGRVLSRSLLLLFFVVAKEMVWGTYSVHTLKTQEFTNREDPTATLAFYFSTSAAPANFFSCSFCSRLHSLLCPPSLQCFIWHSLLQ